MSRGESVIGHASESRLTERALGVEGTSAGVSEAIIRAIMTLASGSNLGPYEIVGPLGAGGMGEVYRARDTRLSREVAIKILPATFSDDAQRLNRFEQEARVLSALNHPNLLGVYDVGSHERIHYFVSELLEGQTLRASLLEGKPPLRKAIDYAVQIATGLAAAHEKGAVHRDLKPENIFITSDGRVKILDFGLAKQNPVANSDETRTLASLTEPGVVLGTVGYMSPEQVRSQPADSRSDIFSFGAILYEMLSGRRAFVRGSTVEIMHAILKEDPPELVTPDPRISPAADRVVRRCLEKSPSERFQSARDLAFALEGLSGTSATGAHEATGESLAIPSIVQRNWRFIALVAAALVIALSAALWQRRPAPITEFVQLTNDTHMKNSIGWPPPVFDTPLATDGARLYLTSALALNEGGPGPAQVSINGGELARIPVALPFNGFELATASPDGTELLIESFVGSEVESSLWIVPVTGGSPRRIDDLLAHDGTWSPDKKMIAYATGNGLFLLDSNNEKRPIFSAPGVVIIWPRFSPDGKRLRFTVEDPATFSSSLWEVRADGSDAHPLFPGWNKPAIECCGEWSGDGRFYFFQTGGLAHSNIWAVEEGLFGTSRPFQITAGPMKFASPLPSNDGKFIFAVGTQLRYELIRINPANGELTAPARLPSMTGLDYSRDGKWVVYSSYPDGILWRSHPDGSDRLQLTYTPLMAASPKWSPDGTQIAFTAVRIGEPLRIEIISADGGTSRPIFPEERNQCSGTWSADGAAIFFGRLPWMESGKHLPIQIEKVDLHTHQISELPGSQDMLAPAISPDGKYLAALHSEKAEKFALYDFKNGRWTIFDADSAFRPAWLRDSSAVAFITHPGVLHQYRPTTRQVDAGVKIQGDFHTFSGSLEGVDFLGIGLDDAPLVDRDQRSTQLYAIHWPK
jgi:eukaryotic-like serine/threonine-protein kinase